MPIDFSLQAITDTEFNNTTQAYIEHNYEAAPN